MTIDYKRAVGGHLKIVPEGDALVALAEDYDKMIADEVMLGNALTFEQLMRACSEVEIRANTGAATQYSQALDAPPLAPRGR